MNIANKILLSSLMAGAASLSHAAIVDFNDVPLRTTGIFTTGGFDFNLSGTASTTTNTHYCGPSCPINGTMLVLAPYGDLGNGVLASLTMARSGGGAFALAGFEGSGSFNFNEQGFPDLIPIQIDVVGQLIGGGSVSQSFAIDKSTPFGPMPLVSYAFNGSFTNLASVTFTSSGSSLSAYNGFAIDNINVSAVPEPESYAMLMAGLGLLGFMARRRRRAMV